MYIERTDNPRIVFDSEEEFDEFSRIFIFGKKLHDEFIDDSKKVLKN